jgi:2'-5' RNA ligase
VSRLFVAVYPPAEIVDALRSLPREADPNVRWVPDEQLHVTVRFFGSTDVEPAKQRLAELVPSLAAATAELGPRVSRLGRSVVCLPAAGLDGLAGSIAEATADLGEPPDPRPFRGHLTLARLRHRAACGLTGAAFERRFVVELVHLVESVTRSAGAEHATVASWALGT